jgi:hypothetical protein
MAGSSTQDDIIDVCMRTGGAWEMGGNVHIVKTATAGSARQTASDAH